MSSDQRTLYMLSGGGSRSDWVKNLLRDRNVEARIGKQMFAGRGRVVQDRLEEREARKLIVAKYYGRDEVNNTGWEATALPVAVDLKL